MRSLALAAFAILAACAGAPGCGSGVGGMRAASATVLPPSDDTFSSIAANAPLHEVEAAVEAGLRTPEKGPDFVRFVVLRAADRHGVEFRDTEFHVIVGAGVDLPAGALRVRKHWIASGMIDGVNEQLQTMGISIAVERGAPQPFPAEVAPAVAAFCRALAARTALHPDCIVAMGEVPYALFHASDAAERELAVAVRAKVPAAEPRERVVIVSGESRIEVAVERRDTHSGITTGMMLRRGFGGENRGMLFVYKFRSDRNFWMRNVYVPIDLAYIREGVIEMIHTMKPEAGTPPSEIPFYPSNTPVRYALELPGGWFAGHGVKVGDRVELE